jgi:hypothetical protein
MMMMMNKDNIYALSRIGTHSLSVQAIKAYASESAATGTIKIINEYYNSKAKQSRYAQRRRLGGEEV